MAVFVDGWGTNYDSAYLVTQDDAGSTFGQGEAVMMSALTATWRHCRILGQWRRM